MAPTPNMMITTPMYDAITCATQEIDQWGISTTSWIGVAEEMKRRGYAVSYKESNELYYITKK